MAQNPDNNGVPIDWTPAAGRGAAGSGRLPPPQVCHPSHPPSSIDITVVDAGTPAHQQGVPPNSLMVSVNGQLLEEMLKQRSVLLPTVEEQEMQTVEEQETIRRVVRKYEHLQRAFTSNPPKGAATE